MTFAMSTTEIFLIAMLIIFTIPYLIWRVFNTDYYAPLRGGTDRCRHFFGARHFRSAPP
jgi:hypothetical protein